MKDCIEIVNESEQSFGVRRMVLVFNIKLEKEKIVDGFKKEKEKWHLAFINDINESGGLIHSYQTPVLSFRMPVRYWLTHRTLNDRKVRTFEIGTSKSRFAQQKKRKLVNSFRARRRMTVRGFDWGDRL